MTILLAVTEPNFTAILRNSFVSAGLDVNDNDVLHRNYLNEIIELEKPSMIIVHDTYLPSDKESASDRDEEMLRFIESWRTAYDDKLRIVYLCQRDRKDPFLGRLVARNVLDIFNERHINTGHFIEQIKEAPRFSNVSKFGIGSLEIEFEEEPIAEDVEVVEEEPAPALPKESPPPKKPKEPKEPKQHSSSIFTQVADKARQTVQAGTEWHQQWQKEREGREKPDRPSKEKKPPRTKTKEDKETDTHDVIDLMPIAKEVYMREPVIGTVVIAVAGARPHIGCTHTAMSIASYLQHLKRSVAVIELNGSEDFDRIHSLYEGEPYYIDHETKFDYKGIDHYKFREDIRLGEIMATYEYVVLDFGTLDDHPYYSEYLRSHVRLMLTSPFEWKQHWTEEFCESVNDPEHYIYVVPFGGKSNVKDMRERFPDYTIFPFPPSHNPYSVNEEEERLIQEILQGFLHNDKRSFSKKTIIVACLSSVAVTAAVLSTLLFL